MAKKKRDPNGMSFLEHVEVLRGHLIRSIAVIVVLGIVAFVFKGIIFDEVVFAPMQKDFVTNVSLCKLGNYFGTDLLCINQEPLDMQSTKMAAQLKAHITVSLIAGFLAAFPYVFLEFWSFLKPALNKREIKHSRGAVFFASTLFTLGAAFGYFIILPLSIDFLGNYQVSEAVKNEFLIDSYIQTFNSVVLASGIIFELPIMIFFLSKIGLVTPDFLKKYRKHSFIIVLTLSAIITPPDIFSQILVSVPLVILYEAGILISKRIERKEEAALAGG